jgi:hypothetical protein
MSARIGFDERALGDVNPAGAIVVSTVMLVIFS